MKNILLHYLLKTIPFVLFAMSFSTKAQTVVFKSDIPISNYQSDNITGYSGANCTPHSGLN